MELIAEAIDKLTYKKLGSIYFRGQKDAGSIGWYECSSILFQLYSGELQLAVIPFFSIPRYEKTYPIPILGMVRLVNSIFTILQRRKGISS